MKNLKIGTRMLIGFLTLIALIIVLGVFSFIELKGMSEGEKELAESCLPSVDVSNRMNTFAGDCRKCEYEHLALSSKESKARAEKKMEAFSDSVKSHIRLYKNMISNKLEEELFNEFIKEWDKYLEINESIFKLSRLGRIDSADVIIASTSRKHFEGARSQLTALVQFNMSESKAKAIESHDTYISSVILIIIVVVISIIIGIVLAFYISGSISKGINLIQKAALKLSQGDMEIDLEVEIGRAHV